MLSGINFPQKIVLAGTYAAANCLWLSLNDEHYEYCDDERVDDYRFDEHEAEH